MNKYYGRIGYVETVEDTPGVWVEKKTERYYYGDVISNRRMLQSSGQVNDNVNISCQFSILADPYAYDHFHAMRYLEFSGVLWKVTQVDASNYPKLILTVGGVYNGKQA